MGNVREGRTTVYNEITSPEKMKKVNQQNIDLENDFLDYLGSIDRSKGTIKQYKANLHVFWCWNLEMNSNKFFVDLTKREVAKFQSYAINAWGWSPKRIRTVKATLSSLSNYIENMLDDEFPDYRPIINKIESPANETVRTKSIFTKEELQHLLDVLVEKEHYMQACFVSLAMNSGKRKAELLRFKVSYFDESNLICGGALYKTPEKMVTKGRGQRGKLLDVYILAKPFQPYLDMWMKQREELGIDSIWLFPKRVDGKWVDEQMEISQADSWAKTFSRILGKPWYAHSMRHWYTSYLLDQNLPESIVQSIQGWEPGGGMVNLYDDRPKDAQFEKYFGAEGIKQVEKQTLDGL